MMYSFYILSTFLACCYAICPDALEMKDILGGEACALLYTDDVCTGIRFNIYLNEINPNIGYDPTFYDSITSLQVRPGCHLSIFEHENFEGKNEKLEYIDNGHYNLRSHPGLNDAITSFQCICDTWIKCKPKDAWIELDRFEVGKNMSHPATYTYTYTTGTEDTTSSTTGSSNSTKIDASIGITLKSIFSASAGISQEWKNWQETTVTSMFYSQTTRSVELTVQPGESIILKQRQAACDRYNVRGFTTKVVGESSF